MIDPTTEDAQLLFDQAASESDAGNHSTAAALFEEAGEAFLACGNEAMAALSLRNRGGAFHAVSDYAAAAATQVGAAELADRAEDLRLRLSCLWARADSLAAMREWATVLEVAQEAVPLMRRYEYDDYLGDTILLRSKAEYWLDDEETALASAHEAVAVFRTVGNIRAQQWSGDFAVTVLLYLGRHEEAQRIARRNVEMAAASGGTSLEGYYRRRLGEVLMAAGRYGDARAEFERSRDAYREAGMQPNSAFSMLWLGRALARLGREGDAAAVLRTAVTILDAAGPRWAGERDTARGDLAALLFSGEEFAESAEHDRQLLQGHLDGTAVLWPDDAVILRRLTVALVRQGRAAEANTLTGDLVRAGTLEDGCPDTSVFAALACAAWAQWHGGDRAAAYRDALALADHPGLVLGEVTEAFILEIIGTTSDVQDLRGSLMLGRAQSIYLQSQHYDDAFRASEVLLERTTAIR